MTILTQRIGWTLILIAIETSVPMQTAQGASLLYDCTFPISAQGNPEGQPRIAIPSTPFRIQFFYDPSQQRMTALDGSAMWEVQFFRGIEAITIFKERNIGGNISTVVIVVDGAERGRAVYNRMLMSAGGTLIPSQYYGRCERSGLIPEPSRG
jgi:hypothetical protein